MKEIVPKSETNKSVDKSEEETSSEISKETTSSVRIEPEVGSAESLSTRDLPTETTSTVENMTDSK